MIAQFEKEGGRATESLTQGYLLIPAMDEIKQFPTTESPDLDTLQKLVDGNIELVHVLFAGTPAHMIVNEEGLIHRLPLNYRATAIYHAASLSRGIIPFMPIVGPAVLLVNLELE